jgi:ribosomal subunit interface protein
MVIPVEVTFHNLAHSDAIEAAVREHAAKLDRFHPRITSCRVVVDVSHRRAGTAGAVYDVRVDVTVPGSELFAHGEPPPQRFHEDVHIAIREAFDRIRRELEDHARRQRWDVKSHEEQPRGRISQLFPEQGYGFIETPDGLDVYFHRNSVLHHGFDRLSVGTEVRFVEEEGERGPQASTVAVAGGTMAGATTVKRAAS